MMYRHVAIEIAILAPLVGFGCVTLPSSNSSLSSDSSLIMSCSGRPEVYNEPYLGIACSFTNLTAEITTLAVETIVVRGADREFSVIPPSDLHRLATNYQARREFNNNVLFLDSLFSTSISAGTQGPASQSGGSLGSRDMGEEQPQDYRFSSAHILAGPQTIAPQASIKKAVLVGKPNMEAAPEVVIICLKEPQGECLTVRPDISHESFRLREYQADGG
jgi:hypothetical protein